MQIPAVVIHLWAGERVSRLWLVVVKARDVSRILSLPNQRHVPPSRCGDPHHRGGQHLAEVLHYRVHIPAIV